MYENMTAESILEDMLSQVDNTVRKDEGSLMWNACAKIADALETAYEELDVIRNNLTPDTMDLDHLIAYSDQVGVTYKDATPAIARGVFSQEIPAGTQFYCNEFTYTSGDPIPDTTNEYYMICDEEGADANTNTGNLMPVDYVEGFTSAAITEVLTLGLDAESEDDFRERILSAYGTKSFGGNKTDYQTFINSQEGVGACKPKRREADSPWINIYLLNSAFGVPSSTLVDTIQDAVDPLVSSGEGDGMAPICHHVQVIAATGVTVNVSATLTLDTGYTIDSVKDSVKNAISAYLLSLRQDWQDNGLISDYVRIAQVEARILTVQGVLDVADTEINGSASNLELTYEKVPVMGEVTLNV